MYNTKYLSENFESKKNTVNIHTHDLYGFAVVLYSSTDKQSRTEHLQYGKKGEIIGIVFSLYTIRHNCYDVKEKSLYALT